MTWVEQIIRTDRFVVEWGRATILEWDRAAILNLLKIDLQIC